MKLKFLPFLLSSFCLSALGGAVQNLILPPTTLAVETCPTGTIRYREGDPCEKESSFIHNTIPEYPVTCQNTPSVSYHRESRTPPPDPNKAIVKVESDISLAELGGFGPNLEAINTRSPDALAAFYPFNALFDKPPNTSPFNERESFRTYWRLLSSLQQANAKAVYLTQANQDKINNQTFIFYNKKDQKKEWTIKELYNKLPGCLKKYPVCQDYQEKYQNLNINTQEAYDALMPFNFDNLRGYEVIKYNSPGGGTVTHIMTENLPYIAAINQGFLDPQTGLLNTLSPSWLNPIRQEKFTTDSTIKQEQETSLVGKIENFTKIIKCQNPPTGYNLPAPLTFPKGLNNPGNTLEQTFEIPITTRTETKTDSLGRTYKIYISEGDGEGTTSVQVLNNPKQKDISLGISEDTSSSLFHMFTTAASQQPYQDKNIHAPTSERTGEPVNPNSGDVSVEQPETDIARKGGEPHVKLCELRNKWFIPASLQRNINCQDPNLSELNPTITPPPMGDICAIASAYNVPCCHLGGIWATESGQSDQVSGSCCKSGICGPMQIAGGRLPGLINGDPLNSCPASDESCLCSVPGAWELAARMLLVTKCVAAGECNSFTWQPEFKEKYAIASDEYDPAGYYEGNANGCIPSNYSQCRWGAGKSYCDNVKLYCESNQTLPDNCTQSYCSLVGITCQ